MWRHLPILNSSRNTWHTGGSVQEWIWHHLFPKLTRSTGPYPADIWLRACNKIGVDQPWVAWFWIISCGQSWGFILNMTVINFPFISCFILLQVLSCTLSHVIFTWVLQPGDESLLSLIAEAEAQRGEVTYPWSHSKLEAGPIIEPRCVSFPWLCNRSPQI